VYVGRLVIRLLGAHLEEMMKLTHMKEYHKSAKFFASKRVLWSIIIIIIIIITYSLTCGPGSSVGIATGYRLDGPGIESRLGRDFSHTSRPALGPTHLPV
jgi:hypothetical protein